MSIESNYIWLDGKILKWEKANISVMSHSLHYGSAVFEGIRFYETKNGVSIFRLGEHIKRLFYSASVLDLKIHSTEEELFETIKMIVKKNEAKFGYIRPLAFFGEGKMGLRPQGAKERLMITSWAWGKYLKEEPLNVKISDFIRIHPKSLKTDAKVSGYYVNSILASQEVAKKGYDEALLLDFEGNVAEGPGENIFFVKNNTLITPTPENILNGITRQSVIKIAQDLEIKIEERKIKKDEIFEMDEAFFTGTACEISSIGKINDKIVNDGKEGVLTKKLKNTYMNIVHGKNEKYENWLTKI